MYYIVRDGSGGRTLFLVDRSKCRATWWSEDTALAIGYRSLQAAGYAATRLRHGNVRVVSSREAREIEADNLHQYALEAEGVQ